ncbi:ABC transporter permease [Leucobacter sp. OLJS4]|uniref:ABC transporter permease n=1 Tax=unclassified Leucobacter TaxID=2621730 RepID=UPI000C18DB43|nr:MULTISPECIES: ABC transporter permease [unclassified Leucobacter]PIJ43961.1 ABC transporter permease [Leucobacter sp. OLES1]PII83288.1 ABC transporter permease [Leucobacter sp. OLCALW19]PII86839.1 ABC transporter permease [Leucobacter sp. OLTLW20]PII91225.1 ABC transporter permease [Leucobacter sp. OLAS13]PII98684.1 ABC transporter permease [Leucobacter sp. OLDS2]
MTRFVLTRLGLLVIAWIAASLLVFATLRLLPGDVAQVIGGVQASPARLAELREQLGLDRPVAVQYLDWIGGFFTGDLGTSALTGTPVAAELAQKAQVTIPLTLMSLLVLLVVAVPTGVFAAYRSGRASSRAISAGALLTAAVPTVAIGLLAILVGAGWLGWLPAQGFPRDGWQDPLRALRALVLPALTIGLVEGAVLFRFVRSATLTALDADHVRTARAQGLTRPRALLEHGLPGVGLSIVSVLGLQIAALIVGAVVVEQLFSLPGLGRMLVGDVGNRDLPKVQSTLLVLTGVILLIGALVDVIHRAIDPRLRSTAS